jgi:hypothetical protein
MHSIGPLGVVSTLGQVDEPVHVPLALVLKVGRDRGVEAGGLCPLKPTVRLMELGLLVLVEVVVDEVEVEAIEVHHYYGRLEHGGVGPLLSAWCHVDHGVLLRCQR